LPRDRGVVFDYLRQLSGAAIKVYSQEKHLFLALYFVSLLAAWAISQKARAEGLTLVDQVEALLPDHVGAAVLAIDGGDTVFKHAWGKRRCDRPERCTAATNFRLASVTKQFTAAAILLLVDRGLVSLEDTLDRYFVGSPDYWQKITIHQLLTHTSGLPDYEKLIPKGTTLQLTDQNVLALLQNTKEPKFEPGKKFVYSNSGYTLLGLIVEMASDRPFHRFVRSEVLEKADMTNSVMFVDGMNSVTERAYGHELDIDENWTVADQSLTSAVRGDGGVYSSLNDIEHWVSMLRNNSLLSEDLQQAMFTSHVRTDRRGDCYGYGWFIGEYRSERREMHAGGTRGFSLMLQRFPERDAVVAILLNRSRPDPPGEYIEQIVDRLIFDRETKPEAAP